MQPKRELTAPRYYISAIQEATVAVVHINRTFHIQKPLEKMLPAKGRPSYSIKQHYVITYTSKQASKAKQDPAKLLSILQLQKAAHMLPC
jgi:hypothetical protein